MEVRRRNFLEHDFTPGLELELHHKDLGRSETPHLRNLPLDALSADPGSFRIAHMPDMPRSRPQPSLNPASSAFFVLSCCCLKESETA